MHTTPKDRKKVLLTLTKSNAGGAQKYVRELASFIPKDIYDVAVAAGGDGPLFAECRKEGIRTFSLPHLERDIFIFKEVRALFELIKLLRREAPDILHLNSPKMGGLGGLAGRIAGVRRIIYTNHGWAFRESRPLWQNILIRILSWVIILLSHKTIVLSSVEYNDVRHWPFVKRKLAIISLGITCPDFIEKQEARKKLFNLTDVQDQNQELILSIGELTKNKGYEYAIDALREYHQKYLYFIIGTGELREQLEEKIKSNGMTEKVFLLGYLQNAAAYMKGADIFLLPSIKEGLPYVILEAGYASIPIIATDVGGIRELRTRKEDMLVPPKNVRALLEAISKKTIFRPALLAIQDMVSKTLEQYK